MITRQCFPNSLIVCGSFIDYARNLQFNLQSEQQTHDDYRGLKRGPSESGGYKITKDVNLNAIFQKYVCWPQAGSDVFVNEGMPVATRALVANVGYKMPQARIYQGFQFLSTIFSQSIKIRGYYT